MKRLNDKKYLVFDFDGTIADTFYALEDIGRELAEKYSINISIDPNEARDIGLEEVLRKSKFPRWKIPKVLSEVKQRLEMRIRGDAQLFRDMREVLNQLYKKYSLGIVSSNSEDNITYFLKKYEIHNLFEFIYSDSSLFGKHTVLSRLFKKYNIHYKDVIYVGDENRDIQAAEKLGIKVIAVSWGYNSKKLLSKEEPDYLVDSPKEILKILL